MERPRGAQRGHAEDGLPDEHVESRRQQEGRVDLDVKGKIENDHNRSVKYTRMLIAFLSKRK